MTGVRDYQNFVHSDLSTLLACSVHTGSSPQRASGIQPIATLSQSLHDNEKIVAEMVPLAVRPQNPPFNRFVTSWFRIPSRQVSIHRVPLQPCSSDDILTTLFLSFDTTTGDNSLKHDIIAHVSSEEAPPALPNRPTGHP
jgi:hypothetical protein